jgi:hypothetical protein
LIAFFFTGASPASLSVVCFLAPLLYPLHCAARCYSSMAGHGTGLPGVEAKELQEVAFYKKREK